MSKPSAKPSTIQEQDEPYDLDAAARERDRKSYRFTFDDQEWVLKPLKRLSKKAMKQMAQLAKEDGEHDNVEYMDQMLRAAMGAEQFERFDEIDIAMEDLEDIFERWSAHSGIEPGESSASSDS